jgi:glycosyltransferase involved in cell wall biosynthesis
MTVVVSLTPTAVERDTRTLKHAASLARLGFDSVTVEAEPSARSTGLPFDVITAAPPPRGPAALDPAEDRTEAPLPAPRSARTFLIGLLPERLLEALRRVAEPPMVMIRYLQRNLRTYRALPPADLYYLHSYSQYPAVRLRCLRTGAPFIYDAHDSYFDSGPDHLDLRSSMTMRAFERVERACVRRAAGFTTVSDGVAGLLEQRYGRRPVVVRNCQDARLDRESPVELREVIGAGNDDLVLVMVGQAKSGIGLEQALDAIASLPDRVRLAFVGANFEPHVQEVRERGLDGRVRMLPPVPSEEIASFIASADAAPLLYLPSTENYRYALPNGFFHAVAAGLPILYPPLVEVERVAERHRLGVPIDPGSPDSIAAGVTRLAEDAALVAELRGNVDRAREELSWEREEETIAKLIGDVGLVAVQT